MILHARLYPGTSRIYNLSTPPSAATLIRSDVEHCYSCYRFYDRTCPMVLYSVIFRLTVAQEVLALLNAAFSERDEAKLRLEIANMKLDSFRGQEEKEADARDVQQQLVMSCRRQVADLRDVKANFVRLHNSFSSKMRSVSAGDSA